jgi:hypothetical protein
MGTVPTERDGIAEVGRKSNFIYGVQTSQLIAISDKRSCAWWRREEWITMRNARFSALSHWVGEFRKITIERPSVEPKRAT